jgi:predicted NUDIX family NTP pyrophosphohydrolase
MKTSAGILPFKRKDGDIYVFLIHMGGPYWKNRDRSWSIVKGEIEEGEEPLHAALREFEEETGLCLDVEQDTLVPLGEVKLSGKKNRGMGRRNGSSNRYTIQHFRNRVAAKEWQNGEVSRS